MHDRFITIASFINPTDAHLCRMNLEAEGIESLTLDVETISIDPFYSQAMGGVRIQVRREDAERALELISIWKQETFEGEVETAEQEEFQEKEPPTLPCEYGSYGFRRRVGVGIVAFFLFASFLGLVFLLILIIGLLFPHFGR